MNLEQVRYIHIPSFADERGILTVIEQGREIPFEIKRIFYVHHVKSQRGNHAPMDTDEVLIAVSGSFKIRLYDKTSSKIFELNDPSQGLYVPRLIYLEMFDFTKDTVCLVLANTLYDETRYLRTLEDFYAYVNKEM